MGTDVAIREPQRTNLSAEQLAYIANTEFVPQGLRGNKPAIMACVATGRALGIDDMSSLRLIHVVNGRPTFSAELMVQIVRKHGHSISGEVKEGSCTVTGKRADNGDTMESTWTIAMAQRAGLAGKGVWKAYPEAMLWARAVSQLCRMLFADCFAGGTYTPDELEQGTPAEFDELESSVGGPGNDVAGELRGVAAPVSDAPAEADGNAAEGERPSPTDDLATVAQKKKLNVLVGTLRDAGHITTLQVWNAVARDPWMEGQGDDPHWSPLRDSLTKQEASALIERLQKFADTLESEAA